MLNMTSFRHYAAHFLVGRSLRLPHLVTHQVGEQGLEPGQDI